MEAIKEKIGFTLFDCDNKRYIGPIFPVKEAAVYFASDYLKCNLDKYNPNSKFEIHEKEDK